MKSDISSFGATRSRAWWPQAPPPHTKKNWLKRAYQIIHFIFIFIFNLNFSISILPLPLPSPPLPLPPLLLSPRGIWSDVVVIYSPHPTSLPLPSSR
jgi:hypothetical protein